MVLKKLVHTFLFIGLQLFSCTDTYKKDEGVTIHRSYYNNGKLRSESQMKDGAINGSHCFYYSSGQLKSKAYYVDGVAQGTIEHYYQNGQLESRSNWKNGKEEGEGVAFFPDGSILFRANYKAGKIVGRSLVYHKSGFLRERKLYDTLGNIQHIMAYDKKGNLTQSFVLPYLKAVNDTVNVGEETILKIKFPFPWTGHIEIAASEIHPSGKVFRYEEIHVVDKGKDSVRYRCSFDRPGEYEVWFKFKQWGRDKGDTLTVDKVSRGYSIFVRGKSS